MNLVEGLARECVRVAELRGGYVALQATLPADNVKKAMEATASLIEAGVVALGTGDIAEMIAALQDLKRWA